MTDAERIESTYECDFNLPAGANHSHKTLLYTTWYQELATHADESILFQTLGECDRYENQMLEALGEMLLEGCDHLDAYERLSEFTDGSLNTIAQKMLGGGDGSSPSGNREQQIEKLTRREYW